MSWARAALVRAVKTAAQAASAVVGAGAVFADVQWDVAGGATALAAIVSVLTSLAGLPESDELAPLERGGK